MQKIESYANAGLPYFGYGTLLGRKETSKLFPSSRLIGSAFLDQQEFSFRQAPDGVTGGCSFAANPQRILYGTLYDMAPDEIRRLLSVLAKGDAYEALEIEATRLAGGRAKAFTLRINTAGRPWTPPKEYAALVTDGAAEMQLPPEYQTFIGEVADKALAA